MLPTAIRFMKIKEMVVDFRSTKTLIEPISISIMSKEVGIVDSYKYLGVNLYDRLDWRTH